MCTKSGPARGLWIEIDYDAIICDGAVSGPARGLWIEIYLAANTKWPNIVGPRKGPVD